MWHWGYGGGALLGDFKGEAAGLGPVLMWTTTIGNQDVTLIAKWLHEVHAENRLKGDSIFLTFAFDWQGASSRIRSGSICLEQLKAF